MNNVLHKNTVSFHVCSHVFSVSTVRGKNPQIDGNRRNALICPGDPVCLGFNLLTDFIKICELLSFAVQKLCPLYTFNTTQKTQT